MTAPAAVTAFSAEFMVQGSSAEPYRVRFEWDGSGRFAGYCTCAAGLSGQPCKHKMALMIGDRVAIAAQDEELVAAVATAFRSSDLLPIMAAVAAAEDDVAAAKKRLNEARRVFAGAMRGEVSPPRT